MRPGVHFHGPLKYRLMASSIFFHAATEASLRRMRHGPRLPGWNWFVEVATEILRQRLIEAFKIGNIEELRRYVDAVHVETPALRAVKITPVVEPGFKGHWFRPETEPLGKATVLYLHGGGYSFYPRSYASFIALIATSLRSRLFALDYRLAPENRFPAQLEDALNAYCWLLRTIPSNRLIVKGDSAGGNLALALLLAIRDRKLPQPALAMLMSPATDFCTMNYPSFTANESFDWISGQMALQWADWFCPKEQRENPLVSPIRADLRRLAPIYMQAGRAEILHDSIQAFAAEARRQGADVLLETWADMNHDFQIFGHEAPQSDEALRRIGEVMECHVR
jgi:monoterpene epsilon-lactone hydrolase